MNIQGAYFAPLLENCSLKSVYKVVGRMFLISEMASLVVSMSCIRSDDLLCLPAVGSCSFEYHGHFCSLLSESVSLSSKRKGDSAVAFS